MEIRLKHVFDNCLDLAIHSFKETEESKLLEEKIQQIYRDCHVMLTESEMDFVFSCFEIIQNNYNTREYYIYFQAMKDTIAILKSINVLI